MKKFYSVILILSLCLVKSNMAYGEKLSFGFYCTVDNIAVKEGIEILSNYKYVFSEGSKFQISETNRLDDNIIALTNGINFHTDINFISRDGSTFTPLHKLNKLTGLNVNLDKTSNQVEISSEDKILSLKIYDENEVKKTSEVYPKNSPIIEKDIIYLPLRFICEYFDLNIEYYDFKQVRLIQYSSIISIENKTDIKPISKEKATETIIKDLKLALEDFHKNFSNLYSPDKFNLENSYEYLQKAIDSTSFSKDFSIYYIFDVPYPIYFNKYTGEKYFLVDTLEFSRLKPIDIKDVNLFEYGYMVD